MKLFKLKENQKILDFLENIDMAMLGINSENRRKLVKANWADGMGGIADYGECPFSWGGSYTDENGWVWTSGTSAQ